MGAELGTWKAGGEGACTAAASAVTVGRVYGGPFPWPLMAWRA